jgi:hypothetical protein
MRFDRLRTGDTFYYNDMWFVKMSPMYGYNSCCITKGDLRLCEPDLDVDPSIETKARHNVVLFKDIAIGEYFLELNTRQKYMKLNVPQKAVNLSNGHIKGFDDDVEVETDRLIMKKGIFKYDKD